MQLVYVSRPPAVPTPAQRPPLLLLLHGVGGNERGLERFAADLDPRFLILSLRAPFTNTPDAYRWFDVEFSPQRIDIDVDEAEHSRLAVIQFINDAVMGFGADPRRVYLLGFSQGATLAYGIGLTAPSKLRGIVGIAGRVLPEIAPIAAPAPTLRHLTLLIQQGVNDPVVPLARAHATRNLFADLGVMFGYREYDAGHEITPDMITDACEFLRTQIDRFEP
ncbi:MAG: phospholipase [Gammaproteobacteria bacterium]|nr:phospholipase [Gammaproteobacteria bacterium]